jgi:hypothetical protein
MFTATLKRATMTASVASLLSLSSLVAAKPSHAVTLRIPVENFSYVNGGFTSSSTPFNLFQGNYGFINSPGSALSGSSPTITNDVINRLSSISVSFDYAFKKTGNDTFKLFVSQGDSKQLLAELSASENKETVNLDFTDLFKNFFVTEGVGSFNFLYELSGQSNENFSVAGFNNIALKIQVPEPNATPVAFIAASIAVATLKRKRKIKSSISLKHQSIK